MRLFFYFFVRMCAKRQQMCEWADGSGREKRKRDCGNPIAISGNVCYNIYKS